MKRDIEKELGINIFGILSKQGKSGLRETLNKLGLDQLRLIVRQHCFDPTGLVCRWKNKERVIDHICEMTYNRSVKGDVFYITERG